VKSFLKIALVAFVVSGLTQAACVAAHAALGNPPALSIDRVSVAAGIEAQTYDQGAAESIGDFAALVFPWAVAYSTGRTFSLGVAGHHDWGNHLHIYEGGVRALVSGTGQGDGVQLALGVNGVSYNGEWAEMTMPHRGSWNAGLYGSYNLSGGPDKPVRWYVSGSGTHDQRNSFTTLRLGVRAVFSSWH